MIPLICKLKYSIHDNFYFTRSMTDRKFALDRLRDAGAILTTSEAVILGLCPDAAHPKFRQLQKIVMTSAQDTGLV